jgi:hypothetical protein
MQTHEAISALYFNIFKSDIAPYTSKCPATGRRQNFRTVAAAA